MKFFGSESLEFEKIICLVEECASSPLGKKLVSEISPCDDIALIEEEQEFLSAVRKSLQEGVSFSFSNFNLIEDDTLKLKAKTPVLEGLQLYEIASAIQETHAARQILEIEAEESPCFDKLANRLDCPEFISTEILKSIDFEGNVLDAASPQLARLRAKLRNSRGTINKILKKFFDEDSFPNFVQDDFITIRGGRLVIPIKIEHKNRHKGIVHDRSRGGDSLFFEPIEAVEFNNELASIQADIRIEEARVLAMLTSTLYSYWEEVVTAFRTMAKLDSLVAKSRFAEISDSVRPTLDNSCGFEALAARHPLIDQRLKDLRQKVLHQSEQGHDIVPVDIMMGDKWNILMVTGPNAGGKTVSLKTAGLLAMMAQAGMHVPAAAYKSPVFSTIASDIGDAQDIITHKSSFSSHLYWLRQVMENISTPALLIIDEIAAATDPGEGSALAMATLEKFQELGCLVMVSTHLESLKAFAHSSEHMENCCVEFNPDDLRPTYKLSYGLPGKSNALETARELGLPKELLDRAYYYLGDEGAKSSQIIGKLQEELTQLHEMNSQAKKEKLELEKTRLHYANKIDKVEERAQKELEKIQMEWREFKNNQNLAYKNRLAELKKAQKEHTAREQVKTTKTQRDEEYEKLDLHKKRKKIAQASDNSPLKTGEKVEILGFGQIGQVASDWDKSMGKNVAVDLRGKKITLPRNGLTRVSAKGNSRKSNGSIKVNLSSGDKAVRHEINVIGNVVEDALYETEKFLDEALVNKLRMVRIIHGRGTGALRSAIEGFLREQPYVDSWQPAEAAAGGDAVTVVELVI